MLPIHTEPDGKNRAADHVLWLANVIRKRLDFGMDPDGIHDDLVPEKATEEEYFLAFQAAQVLRG